MRPLIVSLTGQYDVYREPELRQAIAPAKTEETVIVDLTAVDYLDSTALGVLAGMRTERRRSGLPPAHFVVASERLRRIFTVTGLDSAWVMHPTLADALTTLALS